MKQFLRIFCLYLFVLSCLPCSDGEHGHDAPSSGGETAIFTTSHDCPTHEHCNDFCSPFCTCACCGCFTISDKLLVFQVSPPVPMDSQVEFSYQSPFSAGHLSALFRPPIVKLG